MDLTLYKLGSPGGDRRDPALDCYSSPLGLHRLWPDLNADWYATYSRDFYEEHALLSGFREYARGTESEWTFEVDAGPVVDGFGSAASAFGIAAARRNGRFDQAYALSTEVSASYVMADGTMLLPRIFSHAADAPHLGEAALMYFSGPSSHVRMPSSLPPPTCPDSSGWGSSSTSACRLGTRPTGCASIMRPGSVCATMARRRR